MTGGGAPLLVGVAIDALCATTARNVWRFLLHVEVVRVPITYAIDPAADVIHETWEGEITAAVLRGFLNTSRICARGWKTAIVVARPSEYGVARQWQVFAPRFSTDCIFEDKEQALRWLRAPS